MTIIGEYNRLGYQIFGVSKDNDWKQLYWAGNCPQDSTVTLPPDDRCAVSLRMIRGFCIHTAKDLVREYSDEQPCTYGGVVRVEDEK